MNIYHSYSFFALLCIAVLGFHIVLIKLPLRNTIHVNTRALDFVFCVCTAITVGTLLCLYPGNDLRPSGDSAVFIYIGKQMLAGKAPYRDLFDHKGPILYLIQRVGLGISTGSYTGLWTLEVFNMAITIAFMIQVCRVIDEDRGSIYPAILMTVVACGWWLYEGGNFTEEYALPWISMALWVFFLFFKTGIVHQWQILLLGLGFAAVLLLRPNMISVWVALMPVVFIRFMYEKRYQDIGRCTIMFFSGIAVVFLPVLLWIRHMGCLQDFFECYCEFNFAYTSNVGLSGKMFLHLSRLFLGLLLPGVIAQLIIVTVQPLNRMFWINLWLFVLSLLMVEMSGRDYPHYLIVQLPTIIVALTGFFSWTGNLLKKGKTIETNHLLLLISSLVIMMGAVGYHGITGRTKRPERVSVTWLKENTEDTDDVLILGNNAGLYLESGRQTENRFFYQTPPIEISNELFTAFVSELKKHPSDYIIVPGGDSSVNEWMKEVFDLLNAEGYTMRDINSMSVLSR